MMRSLFLSVIKDNKVAYWVLLLIMIIIPFYYWYLPPLLILLFLLWIGDTLQDRGKVLAEKWNVKCLLILFLVFYLWQAIGLLYSDDQKMALSNVFGRLAFALFPLSLYNPGMKIRGNIRTLLKVFSICTILYLAVCFFFAFYRSVNFTDGELIFNPHPSEFPWENYFYGPYFTFSIHPSYFAMFVVLSAFISFETAVAEKTKMIVKFLWIISGIFLIVSLYFISSRAGIIAGILSSIVYSIIHFRRSSIRKWFWAGTIIIVLMMLPVLAKNDRVKYFLNDIESITKHDQNTISDDRIIAWQASVNIISENLLVGVGIGDVRNELVREYEIMGAEKHIKQRLNAHNQFIEIFLENGLIGLMVFLILYHRMFRIAISENNALYLIFLIMLLVFFMFETVLYRLAGVAFFSLFSFLLIHSDYRQSEYS